MNSTRELRLWVDASKPWPDRLIQGDDAAYNTDILERGLASHSGSAEIDLLGVQLRDERTAHAAALDQAHQHADALVRAAKDAADARISAAESALRCARQESADALEQARQQASAHTDALVQAAKDAAAAHITAAETAAASLRQEAAELRREAADAHQSAADAYERGMKDALAAPTCIGKEGEVFVEQELRRLFPGASVEDVSGVRGATDRVLHLDAGCSIHVEVKNTELLNPKQIADFQANIAKQRAAAGLFAFLREHPVAQHGHFEIQSDPTPMVFLYGVRRNPELLRSAVQFLLNSVAAQRDTRGDQLHEIQSRVRAILDGPVQQSIRRMRQSISTLANEQFKMETIVLGEIAEAVRIEAQIKPKAPKPAVKKRCGPAVADAPPKAKAKRTAAASKK